MAQKKARRAASKAGQKKRRPVFRRVVVTLLSLFLVLGVSGIGAFAYLYSTTDLPDPNSDFTTNTTYIFYEDGRNQIGSLAVQNRTAIDYEAMPQVIKDAVVAAENRTFWEDPGFSARGIAASVWSIVRGGEVRGGSTITQQYIKILYLDSERTLTRKVRELILAIKMGRDQPKEEILQGYLNTIYFGRGAYGIQAASKSYFLKDAANLTMPEAAALAAILNNPAGFNPSSGEEARTRLLGRYQYVLDGMLEMGKITQAEHVAARPALPTFPDVPINNRYGGPRGFLVKMVEAELEGLGYTEGEIAGGGYKITTTIRQAAQAAAVNTAIAYANQAAADASTPQDPSQLHVAIASVDTATGGLIALYGGRDYVSSSRNWATTDRPAASTFKAFAALAGLRNGFSLDSRLNGDTFTPDGDTKTIRNEFNEQYGRVTLRRALADSINTAFVDMTQQIDDGPSEVVKAANDAGAPTAAGWDLNNRIALGAAEVSPVNMANAYATFADSGKSKATHIVAKIEDRQGNVVYEAEPEVNQTIDQNEAANLTDALTSVVSEGTGTKASALDRPVAGKTGTNGVDDDITSAWFVGYTKQISTAVMYVAGDSGNEDLDPYKRPQDNTFFGSAYPLMTWVDYMAVATEGQEVLDFDEPKDIKGRNERSMRTSSPRASASAVQSESASATPSEVPSESPTPSEEPTPAESVTQEPVASTPAAPVTSAAAPATPATEAPVTPEPAPVTEAPPASEPVTVDTSPVATP